MQRFAVIAALLLGVAGASQIGDGTNGASLLARALITLALAAGGWHAAALLRKRRQVQAEKNANALYAVHNLRASETPFVLYLRPFSSDFEYKSEYGFSSLARYVESAVKSISPMPVIGVGEDESFIGPGLAVLVDEKWKGHVASLCDRASAIVVVLGYSPGTLWEIEHLMANNLCWKVVFIWMPFRWFESRFGEDKAAQLCLFVERYFEDLGVSIPPQWQDGNCFTIGIGNRITQVCPLYLNDEDVKPLAYALSRLL